ncbi:MAG: hypothetical protein ACO1SV_26950 [Fimbriimonas sp.]
MTPSLRSTVYVRIRRRWLGVRILTWSGKVHVWEGAAEAMLVSGKKGQVQAVPSGAALPAWAVLSHPFVAFAHPRVLIDGMMETQSLVRAWLQQAGWKPKSGTIFVVHVLDAWEGGLSQLELRALQELAKQVGAGRSIVVEGGPELSDPEILRVARTPGLPMPYRPIDALHS